MLKFMVYTDGIDSLSQRLADASDKAAYIVKKKKKKDTSPFVP